METNADPLPRSEPSSTELRSQFVTCSLDELRPHCNFSGIGRTVQRFIGELRKHPIYKELQLVVSPSQLAAIKHLGKIAFQDPILITREGLIIDGYARKAYAESIRLKTISCVELDIDEDEALRVMLSRHRASPGWNQYNRIRLASRLKDRYRREARANQQAGGRLKGSSKLTEASVRKQIASDAGACEANVTKVEQLRNAHPQLLSALANGEIRIHAAWSWRELSPEEQCEELRKRRLRTVLRQPANALALGRRSSRSNRMFLTIAKAKELLQHISSAQSSDGDSSDLIEVVRLNVPGKAVVITEELYAAFWNEGGANQNVNR